MHRALLVLLVACHGGAAETSCGSVASHFLILAKADLAGAKADDATTRAVNDQLPAMRDALAAACTDGAWSSPVRDCLASASDHVAFQACEQQLTSDQRAALERQGQDKAPESSGSGESR